MTTPGRKVLGKRMREVVQVLQDHGPSKVAELQRHIGDIDRRNLYKTCNCLMAMDLITTAPRDGCKANYKVYCLTADHLKLIAEYERSVWRNENRKSVAKPKDEKLIALGTETIYEWPRSAWGKASSVFGFSDRSGA